MSCNSAPPDRPSLRLQLLSISIPLPRPFDMGELERSLQEAIAAQSGPHRLLRWAITAVEPRDPQTARARVEAVITLP